MSRSREMPLLDQKHSIFCYKLLPALFLDTCKYVLWLSSYFIVAAASIPSRRSKDEPSEEDEEDGRGRAFQKRTEKANIPLAEPAHGKKKKKHA